jgi:hypothetical protein
MKNYLIVYKALDYNENSVKINWLEKYKKLKNKL